MEKMKLFCQKLWLDHNHCMIAAVIGLIVGIVLF